MTAPLDLERIDASIAERWLDPQDGHTWRLLGNYLAGQVPALLAEVRRLTWQRDQLADLAAKWVPPDVSNWAVNTILAGPP